MVDECNQPDIKMDAIKNILSSHQKDDEVKEAKEHEEEKKRKNQISERMAMCAMNREKQIIDDDDETEPHLMDHSVEIIV
jgi:hypothetical protein